MMESSNRREVDELLDRVETEKSVKLLHVVESGSRAWGFPSTDSDYDIRFVYLRPVDWYLSVFERSDVLGPVFDGELDASGWDLPKFLKLMAKGNAVTFEWLMSPMVYRTFSSKSGDKTAHSMLMALAEQVFNPVPVFYHYKSMAKRKALEASEAMSAKSYLYGLRAALSARWVVDERTAPPLEFAMLCERYLSAEQTALKDLLERKSETKESECLLESKLLLALLVREHERLESLEVLASERASPELYDEAFRALLALE